MAICPSATYVTFDIGLVPAAKGVVVTSRYEELMLNSSSKEFMARHQRHELADDLMRCCVCQPALLSLIKLP